MSEVSQETIRAVMSELGSRASDRKRQAARRNIERARAARGARPLLACTCDSPGGRHKQPCPVYYREYRAQRANR